MALGIIITHVVELMIMVMTTAITLLDFVKETKYTQNAVKQDSIAPSLPNCFNNIDVDFL
jgi:hypothetical protein